MSDDAFVILLRAAAFRAYSRTHLPWLLQLGACWCPMCDKDHVESDRQYCHVGHRPHTVCFAGAISKLPLSYQLGLAVHELGHMILQGPNMDGPKRRYTEGDANDAGGRAVGIKVHFKGPKTLEWAKLPKWALEALEASS